jgi:DNA-binding MurR/RpiR family transcriptional regulator
MNTKKDLKEIIRSGISDYSRIQKKLASFLVENWNEIPLMSIESIAKETGVSTATVTRFFRRFDFKGFLDFKDSLKGELKETINPMERFKLSRANLSARDSLVQVAKMDIKNINKLLATIREESFKDLVHMVAQADRVYAFGTNISSMLSHMTAYLFNQVGKETHCLDEGPLSVEEKILQVRKNDLLIFFSLFPYSRSTIAYAHLAKLHQLPLISISDNTHSPISEYASMVLAIPRENILFTTSTAAFSVLINAIATELAIKNKNELTRKIEAADESLKPFYFFS